MNNTMLYIFAVIGMAAVAIVVFLALKLAWRIFYEEWLRSYAHRSIMKFHRMYSEHLLTSLEYNSQVFATDKQRKDVNKVLIGAAEDMRKMIIDNPDDFFKSLNMELKR